MTSSVHIKTIDNKQRNLGGNLRLHCQLRGAIQEYSEIFEDVEGKLLWSHALLVFWTPKI